MRLPVTVAGALMPDAHVGYGLPIGGVLATDNAVIPYAVGVDIACRMRLSLYEVSPHLLGQKKGMFEDALWNETAFGMGAKWTGSKKAQHAVLDDDAWYATRQLRLLKDTAMNQLGTSGTGNHFVEWGSFHLTEPMFGLEPGIYLALLSHSGSRGVGAKIADRYSKLAREKHPDLDTSVKYLAWFRWIQKTVRNTGSRWNWLEGLLRQTTTSSTTVSPRQLDLRKLPWLRTITTSHGRKNFPMGAMSLCTARARLLLALACWESSRLDGRCGLSRARQGLASFA